MATYIENLIVRLNVLYVFSTHVKFLINQMLFILHKFRLQKI